MSTARLFADLVGAMYVAFATICLFVLLLERSYDTLTAAGVAVTIPASCWVFGHISGSLPSKESN